MQSEMAAFLLLWVKSYIFFLIFFYLYTNNIYVIKNLYIYMKKKIKLNENKLKSVIDRVIKEEFSDATTFNKSLWVIVPNAALKDIKSKGGLFPYNGDTSVVTKGVYLCNDKNAIQAYRSPNSSYVEVDFGKLMSSLRGTRNANIQKRDFNGAITYIVPYVPSDCISSVEPCGRGGQLQEEKHLNKLTESDLHRIVKESVSKMLKENTANVESQFADIITGLDAQSASFIAGELARAGQETIGAMTFIIEHFNGYGYGGPDVNGNYDY